MNLNLKDEESAPVKFCCCRMTSDTAVKLPRAAGRVPCTRSGSRTEKSLHRSVIQSDLNKRIQLEVSQTLARRLIGNMRSTLRFL